MFDLSGLFENLDFAEQGRFQPQSLDDFTRKRLNITETGDVSEAGKSYRGLMEKNVRYDASINRDKLTNQALGQNLQDMEESQYQNVLEDLKQVSSNTGFDLTSDIGSKEDRLANVKEYVASVKEEMEALGGAHEKQSELANLYKDLTEQTKGTISELMSLNEDEFGGLLERFNQRVNQTDLSGTNLQQPTFSQNTGQKPFSSLGREDQLEKLVNYTSSIQSETGKFERGSEERGKLSELLQSLSDDIKSGLASSNEASNDEWSSLIHGIEEKINKTDLSGTNLGRLDPENVQQIQPFGDLSREEQIKKLSERKGILESDTKNLSNQRNQNIREFASHLNPATTTGLFESLVNSGREQMGNEVKTRTSPELISELYSEDQGSLRNALYKSGGAGIKTPKSEEDFQDLFENMKPEEQEGFREQLEASVKSFRERQANFFVQDIQRMEDEVSDLQREMLSQNDDEFLSRIRQLRERNEISESQATDITSMPREEAVSQYGRMIGNTVIQQPSHWQSIGEEAPASIQSTYNNVMGQDTGATGGGSTGAGAGSSGGAGGGIGDIAAAYGMGMAGGTLSGAAAGGVGGGSGRGSGSAAAAPSPGDSQRRGTGQAQGRGGRIGNFLQNKAGLIGGGLAVGGFLSDVATPGGRSGAETVVGGASSMGTPLGAAAGLALTGGNPAGAAIGGMAGQYIGQAVGQAAQPYLQFQQSQRSIQQITGERQDRSVGGMVETMMGGGDSIQAAQTGARWSNPFLPTEEIQKLTDQMLTLGASTEQAAEAIGPATQAINEFAMSSELAGTLAVTGMLPGNQFGSQNPYYQGRRIQTAAQEGGMTQQSISDLVQSTTEQLGPTIGFENAPGAAISTATTLSRGGMESDMILEQQQTGQKLMQGMGTAASDVGTASMLGVDPNLTPEDPEFEAQTREGQIKLVRRITDRLPKDEEGNLTVTARNTLQSQLQSYGPALGDMSVDEAEEIAKGNITPEQARKDSLQQNEQDKQDQADLNKRASGAVGKVKTEYTQGVRGFLNKIPGTSIVNEGKSDVVDTEKMGDKAKNLYEASSKESGPESLGALGVIAGHEKGFDPSKVKTTGGETLQQIASDPKQIKKINEGNLKLNVGGEELTARQLSEKMLKDEAFVGKKGGIRMGQKEEGQSGGGGQKVEVVFSGEAERFFKTKDVRQGNNQASEVQAAQDRYARNHKGQRLNDTPRYG